MTNGYPTQDFSEKELKWSYWYITHKIQLRKVIIGIIIGVDSLLMIFVLYGLTDNFFLKYTAYKQSLTALTLVPTSVSNVKSQAGVAAQDIQLGNTIALFYKGKYDIAVPIYNPNDKYIGYFDYRMKTVGGETDWTSSFILPKDSKYLLNLGQESSLPIGTANIEFKNFKWEKILDYETVKAERIKFLIEDVVITRGVDSKETKVSFTVQNQTAYTFRNFGFLIFLTVNDQPVGMNYTVIDSLDSGAKRTVESVWYENYASANKVNILPEINILDEKVFKKIK